MLELQFKSWSTFQRLYNATKIDKCQLLSELCLKKKVICWSMLKSVLIQTTLCLSKIAITKVMHLSIPKRVSCRNLGRQQFGRLKSLSKVKRPRWLIKCDLFNLYLCFHWKENWIGKTPIEGKGFHCQHSTHKHFDHLKKTTLKLLNLKPQYFEKVSFYQNSSIILHGCKLKMHFPWFQSVPLFSTWEYSFKRPPLKRLHTQYS